MVRRGHGIRGGWSGPAALLILLSAGACSEEEDSYTDAAVDRGRDVPLSDAFSPPVGEPLEISSTFGPRWKESEGRYDFHRGIDFPGSSGDPIHAIGDGVVEAVHPEGSAEFPNGGNTLIIAHDLRNPFDWKGHRIERIFSLYLHLRDFLVAEGASVTQGEVVATMGDTGTATFVHLHFEIRLQTICSLEYQTANTAASCAQYGFDPHVHPFLFIGGANTDAVAIDHTPGSPFLFFCDATRGDLDLNELRTDLGTINFDRRTGINATSTAALDDFDYGWVRIVPEPFTSASASIRYQFHFPQKPRYVELTDIYGRGVRRDWD